MLAQVAMYVITVELNDFNYRGIAGTFSEVKQDEDNAEVVLTKYLSQLAIA